MMQVHDLLLNTIRTGIHTLILFALLPTQSVNAQEITILCLYDVLLGVVTREFAKVNKVGCLCDWVDDSCLVLILVVP